MPKLVKLISKEEVKTKVKDLAKLFLMRHYDKKELNFIIILNGAKTFADDFIKEILRIKKIKINKYPITLSSYSGKTSSGKVKLVKAIKNKLPKDVFIIEDIIDTGATLKFLKNYLEKEKQVKSIGVISLLAKPNIKAKKLTYIGFDIPHLFVVGYGLDYKGKYRNLNYIGCIK